MKTHGWIPAIMASFLVLQACGKEASTAPATSETDRDAAPASSDSGADAGPLGSTSLADYDQACTQNSDCNLTFGGPCQDGACWCIDAAVARAGHRAYSEALLADAMQRGCKNLPGRRCESTCQDELRALCQGGRCVADTPPPPQDLGAYDRSCTTVDDCVVVSTDRCYCGPCSRDAIARSALTQFEVDAARLPACGTPGPCDTSEACYFGSAFCEGGRCGYRVTAGPP